MSETTSNQPNSSNQRRVSWGPRLLVIAMSLFMLGAVAFYVTMLFGIVIGEEFAPGQFKRRSFQYYELPLVKLKVSPINRNDTTNGLESHLTKKRIVSTPAKPGDVRWDLVQAYRGFGASQSNILARGDAQILCRYLDAQDSEGESIWLEWSKKHKSLAKVLWPEVANLARQQLYIFIPDLFAIVQEEPDAKDLQTKIDATLSEKFLVLARSQQDLERHDQAVELFNEVLQRKPGNTTALEGRKQSMSALGRPEELSGNRANSKDEK